MDTNTNPTARALLIRMLLGVLTSVSVGVLIAAVAGHIDWSMLSGSHLLQKLSEAKNILTAWDLLALPALSMLVLGIHEVGHVLAGTSQGMRFLMLIVGPFGWLMPQMQFRPS